MPITHCLLRTYKLWHEFLPNMPKDARYTLGGKIDSSLIEAIEASFVASFLPREKKLPHVERAAAKVDLAKFFLQIAWEIRALDNKKYVLISEELAGVGRMLGGWFRQIAGWNDPAARR